MGKEGGRGTRWEGGEGLTVGAEGVGAPAAGGNELWCEYVYVCVLVYVCVCDGSLEGRGWGPLSALRPYGVSM